MYGLIPRTVLFLALAIIGRASVSPGQEPTSLAIYAVDELPVYRSVEGSPAEFDPTLLVMYLKSAVDAGQWAEDRQSITVNRSTRSLFIRQTDENHRRIASILYRLRLFNQSIDASSLRSTIGEASETKRRVLLLVARPESELARLTTALLEDSDFGKVAENYLLRCVPPDRAGRLADAIRRPDNVSLGGLHVIDGEGREVDRLDVSADEISLDRIAEFLRGAAVPLPTAQTRLRSGFGRADESGNKILLIVSGPGCVHCIRLKAVLDYHNAAISKDFVRVDLDTRMNGVEAVGRRFGRTGDEIPWYAVLDAGGEALITSESETGNIGFPADDEDREHFRKMFASTRKDMTAEELSELMRMLRGES